jgi:hypothetical protein
MLHTNVRKYALSAILLLLTIPVQADVNLTAYPTSGGSTIRFGRVDLQKANDQEVTIRITSTGGQQYQVFQRLSGPMANEQGMSLGRSVILTGGKNGSNSFGSYYLLGLDTLGYSDQLIYSSDTSGHSDSFSVIYRADPAEIRESGNFMGNILYTVRPTGGGSQSQVVMRIFLESIGSLNIQARSSSGLDSVNLRSEGAGMQTGYFSISYKDNYGDKVSIYQEILEPLRDDLNQNLQPETVQFSTSGDCKDQPYQNSSTLERKRVLLCSDSNVNGTLTVNFQFSPQTPEQKAGLYYGRIRYTAESSQGTKVFDVTLKLEVLPIFKMEVEYPAEGMNFNRLLPTDPPQLREVIVKVRTNLGRPYNVTQMVSGMLTNEKGQELNKDYFTFRQELAPGASGKIFASDFIAVPLKDTPLFYSDPQGSPAQFKVVYRLRPFEGMLPGSYNTSITFSLGEI